MKHGDILRIYEQKLKYLNYSHRTVEIYSHYASKFLEKVDKYPQHIIAADFTTYFENYTFSSVSQQNQIINAVKFLYTKVLNRKYGKVSFERPRTEKHLPRVIDGDFLKNRIWKIENLKHRAIIMLAYSAGLRVSEVINLKLNDIDSNRMIIHINQAKGKKDRIVPLSANVLDTLRMYYRQYKPTDYLFNGQNKPKYSASSCNQLVKHYLGSNYHFHLLRHSCFTRLLETGTDLRIIQKIAGHNSSKTTEIYTHVSNQMLNRVTLPI